MKMIEERLKALEEKLGISMPDEEEKDLDTILKRLELLENVVNKQMEQDLIPYPVRAAEETQPVPAQTEEGVAPPPTGESSEMEWKTWDGTDEDLEEFQDTMTSDAGSGGYLNRYGSPYGLEINGYGIVSYFFDDKRDISSFRADGFELDLTKRLTDWAILGVDLDFINEGLDPVFPPFRHPQYGWGLGSAYSGSSIGNDDDDDFILEQLFLRARVNDDLEVTGGKFNVPVGLERRDPHQRYTIAPSLLFQLWPRDLTGIMATYQVNEKLSLSPYIFNGWDLDENNNDSFIYALYGNFQATDTFNIASTVAYGAAIPNNNNDQAFLYDIELRYTGIPKTWLGLEYMFVTSEVDHVAPLSALGNVTYHGFLGMLHYDFDEMYGITFQSSLVLDEDGFLWGTEQDRWEVSIIPSIRFSDSVELRAQYQHVETDALIGFRQKNGTTIQDSSDDLLFLSAILSF